MKKAKKNPSTRISGKTFSRREFVAGSAVAGAALFLPGALSAAPDGKKTFTILHSNDMHSAFIGMGPAADYSPFTLNDDTTRGGYARMGALIAKRKEARNAQGPVLVLDAGDYSMGTPFAAASREIGGELQLMGRMGYDAATFGNHETDLGPDGLGKAINRPIDITGKDARLYSLTCPTMLAMIVVAIPKYTKGKLPLVPKNKEGQPLKSRVEALDDPRSNTPTSYRLRVRRTRAASPWVRARTPSTRSRNGRPSWITSAACRSRPRVNCR